MIPYGRQSINQDDLDAVQDVLTSSFLTQGPAVPRFEESINAATSSSYAVAANSATSSLHVACLALDVGPGDLVWTSPVSFVASANCALYCGAEIDFVDIDPDTFNMSMSELKDKLESAKQTGQLPKVVIPVHLCGQSCDMKALFELSQQYGFSIIEDASHAIGASYQNQPVGSCKYSDITVFSFHPVKIITTAEGGCTTTQDKSLADRMRRLTSHGVTRDPELMVGESHGGWYYQQIELGLNYRMTEMQAALGSSQISRLKQFVSRRNELASRYNTLLSDLPLSLPTIRNDCISAYHLYVIQLELDEISKTHKQVFTELRESGIGVNLHYIPIHLQPYYNNLGFSQGDFPVAEEYYSKSISIPLFHDMSNAEQDTVVEILKKVLC